MSPQSRSNPRPRLMSGFAPAGLSKSFTLREGGLTRLAVNNCARRYGVVATPPSDQAQWLSDTAVLFVSTNFLCARRRLQHAEPGNREIVDFDRPELGSADDQAANCHRSNRDCAYGKGAQRCGPEGESRSSALPPRWPHFPAHPPPLPLQVMLTEPTHQTGTQGNALQGPRPPRLLRR
jgi:hypothetical protein